MGQARLDYDVGLARNQYAETINIDGNRGGDKQFREEIRCINSIF